MNEVQRDHVTEGGVRHRTWLFKPGQRANLLVPVEQWKDQIHVPVRAIVQEGANVYAIVEGGPGENTLTVNLGENIFVDEGANVEIKVGDDEEDD